MPTLNALPLTQGPHTFYLCKIKASSLFSIAAINQRIEGKEEGYQRVLSPGRVRSVARYIKANGVIPGTIIASFEGAKYSAKTRKLSLPSNPNAGWIIDGQHRLAGAHEASQEGGPDIELPLIAFVALPYDKQIELFITINREAKNVPSSLYLDLLKQLPKKKTEKDLVDERITDIARTLNSDDDSPFSQRIIFTRTARAGEISVTNFARVLRPFFSKQGGTLNPYTQLEQAGVIGNYYRALGTVFPAEFTSSTSVFFRTTGFGAVWRVFPFVFTTALSVDKSVKVSAFAKIFKQIQGFDFSAWGQYGSGTAAEIQAGDDLLAVLQEAFGGDGDSGTGLKWE